MYKRQCHYSLAAIEVLLPSGSQQGIDMPSCTEGQEPRPKTGVCDGISSSFRPIVGGKVPGRKCAWDRRNPRRVTDAHTAGKQRTGTVCWESPVLIGLLSLETGMTRQKESPTRPSFFMPLTGLEPARPHGHKPSGSCNWWLVDRQCVCLQGMRASQGRLLNSSV